MADTTIDHMQIAKDEFLQLSKDDRLIFIGWARKEADKDLYGIAQEERSAFAAEVRDGIDKGLTKAEELGRHAADIVKDGTDKLTDKFKKFLDKK